MQNSNQAKKTSKSTEKRTTRHERIEKEQTRIRYNVEVRNQHATLATEGIEQSPEEDIEAEWDRLKTSLTLTTKKEWMTEEILQKMEERKGAKNEVDIPVYRVLDREVRAMCDEAKHVWINQQCSEIEELESKHETREMYEKVKEVTGTNRKKSGNSCIKNKEGKVFDQQEIHFRWPTSRTSRKVCIFRPAYNREWKM